MVKIPHATHEGDFELFLHDYISGQVLVVKVVCANLDNGIRVISESAFLQLIGRSPTYRRSDKNDKQNGCVKLPPFLEADNLQPFIDKDVLDASTPISYITKTNTFAKGYTANLLPSVCRVYTTAHKVNALYKSQLHIYERCDLISDALINVAIVALIDEATGYQYDRPKDTLQALMALYLDKDPNKWNLQFKETFYEEISRLREWKYVPYQRTPAFAQVTVDLVYKRIQPGLWEELKKTNPNKKKYRYHQLLTDHIGNPHLREHLRAVTKLMQGCTNWNQFMALVNRTYPLNDIQMDIFFDLLLESPEDFEKYKDLVS
jgi:hypothetical protein